MPETKKGKSKDNELEAALQQLLHTANVRQNTNRKYDWDYVLTEAKKRKVINVRIACDLVGLKNHQQARQRLEYYTRNQNVSNPSEITNPTGVLYRFKKEGLVFYAHVDAVRAEVKAQKAK